MLIAYKKASCEDLRKETERSGVGELAVEDGERRLAGVHRVTARGDEAGDGRTAREAVVASLNVVVAVVQLVLENAGVVAVGDLGHGDLKVGGKSVRKGRRGGEMAV